MWNPVSKTKQKPKKVFVFTGLGDAISCNAPRFSGRIIPMRQNGKSISSTVCYTLLCSGLLCYGGILASSPSLSALSTHPLFHLIALSDWFRFNACMQQAGRLWVKQIAFKWANPIQTQSSQDLLLGSVFRNLIESTSVPWLASGEMGLIYFNRRL